MAASRMFQAMSRRPEWPSLTCINFAVSNQLHGVASASERQSNQPKLSTEVFVQLLRFCSMLPAIVAASGALAADADNGKRLAEMRCVTCHIVSSTQRRDVTDAPPFEAIARKFASNPDTLAFSIIDPHPRMNVTLTRREAQDVAAYINTLAK